MYRRKIKELVHQHKCPPLSSSQLLEIKNYYNSFGLKGVNTDWHRFYTHMNGIFYKEYIPEDLFYSVIIDQLNMSNSHYSLTDKNLLSKFFHEIKQPWTIVKNINGTFCDEDNQLILADKAFEICHRYSTMIVKPTLESGGGKNVVFFSLKDGMTDYKEMDLKGLLNYFDKNYIIQEPVEQHEQMSLLNESSVNTIKFYTLLIDTDIEILIAFVRVGIPQSKLDNMNVGGIWCCVDEDGRLIDTGYDKDLTPFNRTGAGTILKGFQVPNYHQMKEVVKNLHRRVPYFKIISWDLAIDKQGNPVLIEYNVRAPGIDFQAVTGPIFKSHTDQLLRACKFPVFFKKN